MYKLILSQVSTLLFKPVPATGIGVFRILYGLVTLQEIIFLYYFNHLIFDPIPFIDVEFPTINYFLCFWGIIAVFLTLGYRYQFTTICNYLLWLVFVNFTPMQRDFDGGFDLFMTGLGFFLIFMPGSRALSLDILRDKLQTPFNHIDQKQTVTVLAYYLPIAIALGFLYFDSAIHKLFAEHWRNGLGAWLPATQPYYVSALDMSFLLNIEWLEKTIGYTILVFQFSFLFFFANKRFRIIYLLLGICLHLGITLSFNIYPFGLGMLICYSLLVPFSWWRFIAAQFIAKQPALTVFYDQDCPLCNRTVLIIRHFDICKRIGFKSAQAYAAQYPALAAIDQRALLTDLYALDADNHVYSGLDTYIQICFNMRTMAFLGLLFSLPGIKTLAATRYRQIADSRSRITCTDACINITPNRKHDFYEHFFVDFSLQKPKASARIITKIIIVLLIFQLNSTIHYGIVYRVGINIHHNAIVHSFANASNALIEISQLFLGIAPHALYLHDHFAGYDRIVAITYTDVYGQEQWLPFVNQQGRLLAPNWGRVHSMWANVAVTPNINNVRLQKFIMKVTAFWGHKLGLNINNTEFHIKLKKINAPSHWVYDQLHQNFSSPWVTIGSVRWSNNTISYNLPNNINSL